MAIPVRVTGDIAVQTVSHVLERMFDLNAPIEQFLDKVGAADILRCVVTRKPGLRLPVFIDPFEGMVPPFWVNR
jgi:hypothetical protein